MMETWSLDTEFLKTVHSALKHLHQARKLGNHALTSLAGVRARQQRYNWPDTAFGRAAALQQLLEDAREALAQEEPEAAALLKARFWQREGVLQLAQRQHVAESTIYDHQSKAIQALVRNLWKLEQAVQTEMDVKQRYLTRNIPPPNYLRLLGRDEPRARLQKALTAEHGPWLISIEGLGGVGKTALAHRLATWAAGEDHFSDIAWASAQQQKFAVWRGIVEQMEESLAFEALLDSIALQLGYKEFMPMPISQKKANLQTVLKANAYLIVVDHLKATADHNTLLPQLWSLANPTRFLFTGRYSLRKHPQVFCLTLNELSEADSLAFIRFEARERGATMIAEAEEETLRRIYSVTGGNPLAIKLIVGQARTLPLERVLTHLRKASRQPYEDLYRFIYRRCWETLDADARQVLLTMSGLSKADGLSISARSRLAEVYWPNLQAVTKLDAPRLDAAIEQLVTSSLLQVDGQERRYYTIHRLTHTFLMSDILKRWH